ncbi:MAG: aminoglycoside phosphotransferase [Deltaproteobacteria bacterium]|jgi:rubrerythrin|nr:aminoglycoside phosphotransferase [Deltaproteobacteria bacterium]MBW2518954.1 aminoglycoside phosphotransferase [Deltaproteobacteria bacterium]
MRYEQLHNVLHHLAPAYHRTVSDYYQSLADGDVSPRIRLMLDYLIDHEQSRALALGEYCREASSHVQDHWIKGLEINFPEARPEELDADAAYDLDKLIKAAVSYKKTLIDYFSHLLEHCTERDAQNLLQTLKTQEEKAMKRMIRHYQGLADL